MIILNQLIILFVVMGLASLSGLFSERSGTVNIGINGMMLFGGLTYWSVANQLNGEGYHQMVHLLVACLAGVGASLAFAFAVITLKANQVISGTAINMISAAVGLLLLGYATSAERSLPDPGWAWNTDTATAGNIFSVALVLGIIIFIASFIFLKYTAWGLRLKAAGENPQALDSQGINVINTRYTALIIAGALAGLAGGIFIQNLGSFSGSVHGLGFVGLTILIAGQWRIHFVLLTAFVFASLYAFANNMNVIKTSLSEIKPLLQTLPFILSLVFLVVFSKSSRAPVAAGVAYDKGKR